MIKAKIKSWNEGRAWASWGDHEKEQFRLRIKELTSMSNTEIKRLSRSIFGRTENGFSLDRIDHPDQAEALRHLLESLGADIEFIK